MAALVCLTGLEATYILVPRNFSSEIFAGVTLAIGTILGAFAYIHDKRRVIFGA